MERCFWLSAVGLVTLSHFRIFAGETMRGLQFVSKVLLGIVLVMLCAGIAALISMAPTRIEGGIASVYLGVPQQGVRISGHQFTCTQEPTIDRCTVEIQGQPLVMQVAYDDGTRRAFHNTATCQTTYGDRPVECGLYYDYATGDLPNLEIQEPLGLSQQTIQQLRRENFLIQSSDHNLLILITSFAITCGLLTALNLWFYPHPLSRSFAGLSHGVAGVLAVFTFRPGYWLYHHFLGETTLLVMAGLALAIGILLGIAAWSYNRQIAKVMSGFSAGLFVVGCVWWVSIMVLLVLGYVD
jgi:hypothetical protein